MALGVLLNLLGSDLREVDVTLRLGANRCQLGLRIEALILHLE